jgi:hypothetical protein
MVVVTAIATGFRDIIAAFFKRWVLQIESGKKKYIDGVRTKTEFHECLERIGRLDFVDRVLIFTGTNCGGVPDAKKPYIVRCFYGWSNVPGKNPENQYNFNLKVDAHYMRMIERIIADGVVQVKTDDMPEDSQLRGYYKNEGVVISRLYSLYLSDTELIYCSIASYSKVYLQSEIDKINFEVDRIRSVMYN